MTVSSADGERPDPAVADRGRNPVELTLDELRSLRNQLQREDDAVSYVRRVAQARLDIVRSAVARHAGGADHDLPNELRSVLSRHLTGGPARPPRPTEDLADHPLADELDAVCAEHGFGRLEELDAAAVDRLAEQLTELERRVSADRQQRFGQLDALSAELVRRYRDGEATVDSLLGES